MNEHTVRVRHHRNLLIGGLAAALLVTACGGGDDGDASPVDLADGLPSAAVCNGEPSEVNPPSSDPFSGYVYLNDGSGWATGWFDAFGEQHAIVGDDATAILCVNVTETAESARCDYEEDGETFTLVMASATYEIDLRNADTANTIARDTFSVDAEDCPMIVSWTPGETERTSYPRPSDEQIQTSLGPFLG